MSTPASQGLETVVMELPGINMESARKLEATISESSGKCLVITSPEEIATSSSIRVQGKDLLFLGEVIKSAPKDDGQWSVHMKVKSKFMIF